MTKIYTVQNNSVDVEEVESITFSKLLSFVSKMPLETDFDPYIEQYLITLDPYQLRKDEWFYYQSKIDSIRDMCKEMSREVTSFDEDGVTEITSTIISQESRDLTEEEQSLIEILVEKRNEIEKELPFLSEWRESEPSTEEILEETVEPHEYDSDIVTIVDSYSYDVSSWKLENYAILRKAAYRTWQEQMEMQADGTWEQHVLDVKAKFPKA